MGGMQVQKMRMVAAVMLAATVAAVLVIGSLDMGVRLSHALSCTCCWPVQLFHRAPSGGGCAERISSTLVDARKMSMGTRWCDMVRRCVVSMPHLVQAHFCLTLHKADWQECSAEHKFTRDQPCRIHRAVLIQAYDICAYALSDHADSCCMFSVCIHHALISCVSP